MKLKNRKVKCEMCGSKASKITVIKNRKNGNELKICQTCAAEYGFIKPGCKADAKNEKEE